MNITDTFRRLAYAQIVLGVIAYAVAQQNAPMVLIVGTLSTLSWYVVEGPRGRALPEALITMGVVGATLWLFYVLANERRPLIVALGIYIMALQIAKLYDHKSNRDWIQLIVLSLMQMVSASIISATLIFGVVMALYLMLALLTAMLFQLKLSRDRVHTERRTQAPDAREASEPGQIVSRGHRRHFRYAAGACGAACLCIAAVVFVAAPRGEAVVALPNLMDHARTVSGFNDNVQLSGGERITTSEKVVMTVTLWRDGRRIGSPRMNFLIKGSVLDRYSTSESRWWRGYRTRRTRFISMRRDGRATLVPHPLEGERLRQHITIRLPMGRTLFSIGYPVAVSSEMLQGLRFNPTNNVLRSSTQYKTGLEYTVISQLTPTVRAERLYRSWVTGRRKPDDSHWEHHKHHSHLWGLDPRPTWEQYARGPIVEDPRVRRYTLRVLQAHGLSRDVNALSTPKDLKIARVIQSHLEQNYTYTLETPAAPPETDPILAFLFHSKRGHCEYFASAMCAMARSIGMRARLVTGFRVGEYHKEEEYYVVRQKHAHAWCEVYIKGMGWQTFDPTPARALEDLQQTGEGILASVRRLYNYLEYHWINSVISFGAEQRRKLVRAVTESVEGAAIAMKQWVARFGRRWRLGLIGYAVLGFVGLCIVLGITFLGWTVAHRRRRVRQLQLKGTSRGRRNRLAYQLEFYPQMLQLLERAGFSKPHWQTPAQYANRLAETPSRLAEPALALTSLFYEVRFGGRAFDRPRADQAREHLEQLRRIVREEHGGTAGKCEARSPDSETNANQVMF